MTDSGSSLTERDVQRIVGLIEALERSSFDALEVELDGLKLTLGRGAGNPSPAGLPSAGRAPAPPALAPTAAEPTGASPAPAIKPAPAPKMPGVSPSNAKDVLAPLRGIFYSRPDPSSPPFAAVGATVSAITTIGLVEVMKVFNAIPAGHDGVVVEICVEDGHAVDAGQVLLRLAPAEAAGS